MKGHSLSEHRFQLAFLILFSLAITACSKKSSPGASTVNGAKKESFVQMKTLKPASVTKDLTSFGPVCTNLWTFNALNMYDSTLKSHVFYITSFNQAGGGQFPVAGAKPATGQLIELDYRHNRASAWPIPTGIGSWGIIKGQDGNLYMGSYYNGELMCFNPRTRQWIKTPQAPEAFRKQEFIICDLALAPDGDIYYGTFPGAHLVCYDPHAKTVTDLGKVADENYVRWLAVTKQGIVLCGVGPRHGRVIAYNPATRRFRTITPEEYQTPGVFSKPLVSDRYVVEGQQRPGSRVLVYDPKTFKLLHVYSVPGKNNGSGNQSIFKLIDDNHVLYQDDDLKLMSLNLTTGERSVLFASPGTAANNRWYFDSSGNILGLLVQSYVYINLKTGRVTRHMIPARGLGQQVMWLTSSPDGLIYGGPALGQTFFSFHPGTNLLTSYDQVIDRTGEIYYGIPYKGKLYTISYCEAGLSVFDPSKSWDPPANPRNILYMPDDQYRPVGGIHLGPDRKMYIGTQPDYGLLGGALSVFDPETGKLVVHRNLIPNEEVSAVRTDGHYVYCGADPAGGVGYKPTETKVHFFVWDPQQQKVIYNHTFSNSAVIEAIAAVHGHAYFVQGDRLMEYDSARRTLKSIYHFNKVLTVPREGLKATKDGILWGIIGGELVRIDPAKRNVRFFADTRGRATSGITIGVDGTVYFGSDTNIWSYHPKNSSPPVQYGQ